MGCCLGRPLKKLWHKLKTNQLQKRKKVHDKAVHESARGEPLLQPVLTNEHLSTWKRPNNQEDLSRVAVTTTSFQCVQEDLDLLDAIKKQRKDSALHVFMVWTKKAVALDNLNHEDKRAKCSSSAIDVMKMFYDNKAEINDAAESLASETICMRNAKLIYELCRCTLFYAEEMRRKIETMGAKITPEWCTVVNNIEYVSHSLPIFYSELQKDIHSITERGDQQLHELVEKASASMHEEIQRLLDSAADRLTLKVKSLFEKRLEQRFQVGRKRYDKLTNYLSNKLQMLYMNLSDRYFDYVLMATWKGVLRTVRDMTAVAPKKCTPDHYSDLECATDQLVKVFDEYDFRKQLPHEKVEELQRQLLPRSQSTNDFIHMYLIERLKQQLGMTEAPFGYITVCAHFARNLLHVEVLSASSLCYHPKRDTCNPYVTVQLLPKYMFKGIKKSKSMVFNATVFPLFELKANFSLTSEQRSLACSMVRLAVKDKRHRLLSGVLVGEGFVPFGDIIITEADVSREEIPLLNIKLSRPLLKESLAFRELELRRNDPKATKFVKKEKSKVAKKT